MSTENLRFTDEELETELGTWEIKSHKNGFGSSYKILYKTYRTTVAAKAFHIPDQETGEIHHFDLSIRVFKRKKSSEPWEEQGDLSDEPIGQHRQLELTAGSGKAVRELTNFLLAQHKMIGSRIEKDRVIIDKPTNQDVVDLLNNMSIEQVENFSTGARINTLKAYKHFLEQNLDQNESFIQSWLDQDNGRFRKQRCLIFGLEYIDHKREGELSRKRFDILTRSALTQSEYVIIELKSPGDEIFKIVTNNTSNDGESVEYHLSSQLARAIPQILRYKSKFESMPADDDDFRRSGIEKGPVRKCIILLGTRKNDDPIWESHFKSLKENLSNNLDIWTYTDLIEKLEITIRNLEENLTEEDVG